MLFHLSAAKACYTNEPAESVLQCKRQFAKSGQISEFHILASSPNAAPLHGAARGGCPLLPPTPSPARRHCVKVTLFKPYHKQMMKPCGQLIILVPLVNLLLVIIGVLKLSLVFLTTWQCYLSFITALHIMQTRYCDENSVSLSVCPSVRLSHACIVTKR